MRTRWSLAATVVLLVSAGCGDSGIDAQDDPSTSSTSTGTTGGTPVVVDTDLAQDDFIALLFLLSSNEVDVRAVTVAGTGEVRCPRGAEVARRLLAVTGHGDVPVACGTSTPLEGEHTFPDEWRDAADAAWWVDLPDVDPPADPPTAVDLLVQSLTPGDTTLLTLGPLTNVAEAFRADSELAEQVPSVVIMGGALDVGGNVFTEGDESPAAEWNFYVDPVAAEEVVSSGAPVTLVGLDATNQAPITPEFVDRFRSDTRTEAAEIVSTLLTTNPMVATGDAYFWDPLAATVLVEPGLVATDQARITVVTDEGAEGGRTVRASDGHRVTVAVGVDLDGVEELIADTLNGLEATQE